MGSTTTISLLARISVLAFIFRAIFETRKSSTWPNVFDSTYLTKINQKKRIVSSIIPQSR